MPSAHTLAALVTAPLRIVAFNHSSDAASEGRRQPALPLTTSVTLLRPRCRVTDASGGTDADGAVRVWPTLYQTLKLAEPDARTVVWLTLLMAGRQNFEGPRGTLPGTRFSHCPSDDDRAETRIQ
jgi:hypothetical protein